MVKELGPTEGCPACTVGKSSPGIPHNDECRIRMGSELGKSQAGRDRLEREQNREDKHFEKAMKREVEKDPELRESEAKRRRSFEEPPTCRITFSTQ